ncbi:MAG: molybdenum cofactor biosynthesis protein MoaE [Planctomycetota bacterium]|nr:molybdenum cofactor biosynthesis protein MoaE [Planctomycetota bacterium]
MRLEVRLFAGLRERAGADVLVLEDLPEPLDLAGLKAVITERHPELGDLAHVAGVVGTEYAPPETALDATSEVALLPPVSGGSDAYEQGVFMLSAEPLDPGALQQRVIAPHCGAVCCFTGVTRERNREQDVVELDYEAFEAMAGPEMARIFADCLAQFGDDDQRRLRMLCAHRTGVVGVGEPSVVIAVASPHRDAAFEAARFLIDALKERLPVWKKEVYGDGHHWIGDRS